MVDSKYASQLWPTVAAASRASYWASETGCVPECGTNMVYKGCRSMRRCDHLRHNEPGEELQTNANSVDVRLQRGLRDGRRRMYCRFRMWMSRPWRFVPNVLRYSLVGQTFQYLPRSLTLRFETSRTVIHRCYCYLVLSARSVLVYIGFRTARFCLISRDGFE